jgi:hypothetical protein
MSYVLTACKYLQRAGCLFVTSSEGARELLCLWQQWTVIFRGRTVLFQSDHWPKGLPKRKLSSSKIVRCNWP